MSVKSFKSTSTKVSKRYRNSRDRDTYSYVYNYVVINQLPIHENTDSWYHGIRCIYELPTIFFFYVYFHYLTRKR